MPARDRTGPSGRGPLTGRGRGNCAGQGQGQGRGMGRGQGQGRGMGRGQGQGRGMGRGQGQGRGMGRGRGQGWGRDGNLGSLDTPPEEEVQALLAESSQLKRELQNIEKRLEELEKNNPPA